MFSAIDESNTKKANSKIQKFFAIVTGEGADTSSIVMRGNWKKQQMLKPVRLGGYL